MPGSTDRKPHSRLLLSIMLVCAFCSACLLFVAQPMLAKWLLPSLGGTPATWSACLATFQMLLLVGYGYVHWITRRVDARMVARAHLALVPTACFALWQVDWSTAALPRSGTPTALDVVSLLLMRIGLPYAMLAMTLPLTSSWSAALGKPAVAALNVASNTGALVGLLLYPFVIEPASDVQRQLTLWSAAVLGFGLLMLATCTLSIANPGHGDAEVPRDPPTQRQLATWLSCSLVPSALLLAATGHVTTDIAATPLFWVVPLMLYLLSHVIAFGVWRTSWRTPTILVWGVATAALGINGFAQGAASFTQQLGATFVALFAACLLCHAELAETRPQTSLSHFYLVIAAGGALGGLLVGLFSPVVLDDQYELELASLAIPLVLLFASPRTLQPWSRSQRALLALAAGICLPLLFGSLWVRSKQEMRGGQIVERRRSLLGPLRVVDTASQRFLIHGRIQHGMQLLSPTERDTPTLYFARGTAAERVLTAGPHGRGRHIGIVGMGVGTLAAYGRPGDRIRFYELDGNVVDLAQKHFSFLSDARASIDVVLGDGRLSLQQEAPQNFDVLVLDAFSSDAVPVHLLTREAFAIYHSHLAPDGLLLVNVSNRHLAVDRVVQGDAQSLGWPCVLVETLSEASSHTSHVVWAVIAASQAALDALMIGLPQLTPTTSAVTWTDSRASILSILR
jgi:hypothetical protein